MRMDKSPAPATTNNSGVTAFRNATGQRTGSAVQQGDLTIFYNANGQRTGTAARR